MQVCGRDFWFYSFLRMDEHSKGERQVAQVCFGVQRRKGGARSQIQYTFYTVEELSRKSISVI